MVEKFHKDHPNAFKPPQTRIRTLGVTMQEIWDSTTVLQAQAHPKEGVMSRIASIILPPNSHQHHFRRQPHHSLPELAPFI